MRRLNVNVTDETAAQLERAASETGRSMTEVVRRAIAVYEYLDRQHYHGWTVLIQNEDETREVVLL